MSSNYTTGFAAVLTESEPRPITKADIYQARHCELSVLEQFLTNHLQLLDANYHSKKDSTPSDTIAYYVSKTMCVQFQRELHKMHSKVTDEQFLETMGGGGKL